jgi:hypothetical protein
MSIRTTQSMLNELIAIYGYSIANIAQQTGISDRTVQRLLHGGVKPSIKTEQNVIHFYLFCLNKPE